MSRSRIHHSASFVDNDNMYWRASQEPSDTDEDNIGIRFDSEWLGDVWLDAEDAHALACILLAVLPESPARGKADGAPAITSDADPSRGEGDVPGVVAGLGGGR